MIGAAADAAGVAAGGIRVGTWVGGMVGTGVTDAGAVQLTSHARQAAKEIKRSIQVVIPLFLKD